MKTLADLKRALVPGRRVHVENLRRPHVSGPRVVLKAQTQRWCFSFPGGDPRYRETYENPGSGTWLQAPRASDVTFSGNGATFLSEGAPWMVITVIPFEQGELFERPLAGSDGIEELKLDGPIENALRRVGIHAIGNLIEWSASDLAEIPLVRSAGIEKIEEALGLNGMVLNGSAN